MQAQKPPEPAVIPSIFDAEDPNALTNKLTKRMMDHIRRIPTELLVMNEQELEIRLYAKDRAKRSFPLIMENRIRLSFWKEFDRSVNAGDQMTVSNICRGVTDKPRFYELMADSLKAAWVLCAPGQYHETMEEALYMGLRRMREFLAFPVCKKDGTPDYKVASTQLKIVELLDNRLHGGPTQKIDARLLSVSVGTQALRGSYTSQLGYKTAHAQLASTNQQTGGNDTMADIDKELKFLEEKSQAAQNALLGSEPIDVTGEIDKEIDQ